MPRSKNNVAAKRRHNKALKRARGNYGGREVDESLLLIAGTIKPIVDVDARTSVFIVALLTQHSNSGIDNGMRAGIPEWQKQVYVITHRDAMIILIHNAR